MNACNVPKRHRLLWRFVLFMATVAAGLVVGAVGYHVTGQQHWFLALPALLALVWLFVANPEECCGRGAQHDRDNHSQH